MTRTALHILIVDDEPLARGRMAALLGDCTDVSIVGSVGDGEAALARLDQPPSPDVVLLDISMPGIDGLQLARRLAHRAGAPQIIFCTAFDDHAADAWEVRAADYLLKPVTLERLRAALERARQLRPLAPRPADFVVAHIRGEERRLTIDDVLYFQADDKYVSAVTTDATILLDDSLKGLEQRFPDHLLRLHRNSLVPRERLLAIRTCDDGRCLARLNGTDTTLEVSRRNLPAVRRELRLP